MLQPLRLSLIACFLFSEMTPFWNHTCKVSVTVKAVREWVHPPRHRPRLAVSHPAYFLAPPPDPPPENHWFHRMEAVPRRAVKIVETQVQENFFFHSRCNCGLRVVSVSRLWGGL